MATSTAPDPFRFLRQMRLVGLLLWGLANFIQSSQAMDPAAL